jgi:hypothetical protein
MREEDTEEAMVEDTEADTIRVVGMAAGVMPAVRPIAAEPPFTTPHQHTTVRAQPLTALQRLARVLP